MGRRGMAGRQTSGWLLALAVFLAVWGADGPLLAAYGEQYTPLFESETVRRYMALVLIISFFVVPLVICWLISKFLFDQSSLWRSLLYLVAVQLLAVGMFGILMYGVEANRLDKGDNWVVAALVLGLFVVVPLGMIVAATRVWKCSYRRAVVFLVIALFVNRIIGGGVNRGFNDVMIERMILAMPEKERMELIGRAQRAQTDPHEMALLTMEEGYVIISYFNKEWAREQRLEEIRRMDAYYSGRESDDATSPAADVEIREVPAERSTPPVASASVYNPGDVVVLGRAIVIPRPGMESITVPAGDRVTLLYREPKGTWIARHGKMQISVREDFLLPAGETPTGD